MRKENKEDKVRSFTISKINIEVKSQVDLIDWETNEITEPLLLKIYKKPRCY